MPPDPARGAVGVPERYINHLESILRGTQYCAALPGPRPTDGDEPDDESNEDRELDDERESDGERPTADATPAESASADGRVSAGYDALAALADDGLDRAGSPWGDSYFQEYYAWPAARSILPDVEGERVLLAGCGRGDHVGWFLDRGATVVGVDASEAALSTARDRFGDDAAFRSADLAAPLPFADDGFDLVFSHLVLGHLAEWAPAFREFRRVTAPGGALAFVTIHPEYLRRHDEVETYYGTTRIDVAWPSAVIPTYYRPMGAVVDPLVAAGYRLAAFEEPTPQAGYAAHSPERYEAALDSPQVLCVRANAPP